MAVMSKSRVVPLWPAVAVLTVCLGAAGVAAILFFRAHSDQALRVARLETENREARVRSESLARELESVRRGIPQAPLSSAPAPARAGQSDPSGKLEDSRFIYQLREKLAAAGASIQSLQSRVQELQVAVENAKQESARLAAAESEIREKLNASNRIVEAVQAELKSKGERLTQAEISNRLLKDENRAASEKLNRLPPLVREFEEINRRRDNYLGNVLRRFKEVTEQYRAISDAAPAPELSRITNAIAMAEEDIRQLTALNAQAIRVRQKLGN